MTKKLNDKIGFNVMHDSWNNSYQEHNVERAVDLSKSIGAKYIRPALRIMDDEFENGYADDNRTPMTKMFIEAGLIPIWGPVPAGLQNKLKDSNFDTLMEKVVTIYGEIMDKFIDAGISPDDFIFEAWNEADGGFAMNDGSSQTDADVINKYLEFNKRINDECHKRGVRFMDLDSVQYPKASNLSLVMDLYNQKMASYSSKPEWVSFHPYCERDKSDNNIPEKLMVDNNMNLTSWNNLSGIPIAASEFGYPTEDWGDPFSGQYPYQYSKDMFVRQVIVMDYLNVDPIIIYSANTNPDQSDAGKDECWGTFQYYKDTDEITMSTLGSYEYYWINSMRGYHLNGMVTPTKNFTLTDDNVNYTNFAFEYENDNGSKKLFYWNPFGNNTTSLNWNGQTYNLNFTQHVNMVEVLNAGDSNNISAINLSSIYTDKGKYKPGDIADIKLDFNNSGTSACSLDIEVIGNTPTGAEKSMTSTNISIPAGRSTQSVSLSLPSDDDTSYLLQVIVSENQIPMFIQTLGLDVGDSWTSTPRYAALTNFNPNDQTDKDNINKDIATLNKFNINATMYYDAYYRPQNTIPSDNYQTWIGENVSKGLITQGISTNHSFGMSAMFYNMINATTGTPNDNDTDMGDSSKFKTVTRQDGTTGVESTMGIFRTGKCNICPVPDTFDGLGEQATFNMLGSFNDRDDVDHKVQYYYNPASPDWQQYIGNIMKSSLDYVGFDGWQGDTIGDIYGVPYQDRGTNNNGFHTKDTYADFINAVKPAFFSDKIFGMNAVNYGGQEKINGSKADFNYTELWQSDQPTYQNLATCIRTTQASSDKPLIVPSYMYRDWYNSGSSDLPATFKDDVILIKDAVIFANGGAPMELADNGYQLPTEYYPDTRKHYKIMMSDRLGNPDTGLLRKMYDFVTAYSSLLYQATHTTNLIYIANGNGDHVNSSTADAGKVYDITSNKNGVDILQLVNLTGCSNTNWQVNNAADEATKNITPVNDLKVKMYTNNTGTLYGASYETGIRNVISYEKGNDSNGNYITFTVDKLNLWSIFYID